MYKKLCKGYKMFLFVQKEQKGQPYRFEQSIPLALTKIFHVYRPNPLSVFINY